MGEGKNSAKVFVQPRVHPSLFEQFIPHVKLMTLLDNNWNDRIWNFRDWALKSIVNRLLPESKPSIPFKVTPCMKQRTFNCRQSD